MRNRWALLWAVGLAGGVAIAAGTQEKTHNNVRRVDEAHLSAQPTESEAKAFLDDAESRLFDVGVKQERAAWVEENFITDDTEQIVAEASEQANTLSTELAKKAARFDGLKLPAVMARKMMLLKLGSGFAAPNNPKDQKELAQVLASLDGDYGKGKWCPETGKCLDRKSTRLNSSHSTLSSKPSSA